MSSARSAPLPSPGASAKTFELLGRRRGLPGVGLGESSNGRTADSDSACLGSNPSSPANNFNDLALHPHLPEISWTHRGRKIVVPERHRVTAPASTANAVRQGTPVRGGRDGARVHHHQEQGRGCRSSWRSPHLAPRVDGRLGACRVTVAGRCKQAAALWSGVV